MRTSAMDGALARSRSIQNTATAYALNLKRQGGIDVFDSGASFGGAFSTFQDQAAAKQRYAMFRGWVYSAVNAIALAASRQPILVGKRVDPDKGKPKETKGLRLPTKNEYLAKQLMLNKMPPHFRTKAAMTDMDLIPNHALQKKLEKPNQIQHGFQFTYSFVANLCLTGWGYVIGGKNDETGEVDFYSVPTNWVTPLHDKGAFSEFRIQNPNGAPNNDPPLPRENVRFAYLPNPGNPLGALAPATAQSLAIKIDDQIQSSQAAFFENAVFPGAVVTMGKNPHPAVSGGVRPRLTPAQRRQVYGAIRKVMSGVANYGNPAIVDGMIESIEKLSASQNEIGWEKSEKAIRTRILSAFAVHPFILGEEMIGSYAQAYIVKELFADRVNVFLSLLSSVMNEFAPTFYADSAKAKKKSSEETDLMVWWEEIQPKDLSMEKSLWEGARGRGDVTQNEFRNYMGLPPDEDSNEAVIEKSSVQAISGIAQAVTGGKLTPEQATEILVGMGLPAKMAKKIAGEGPPEEPEMEDDWGSFGDESEEEGGTPAAGQPEEDADPFDSELAAAAGNFKSATAELAYVENVISKSTGILEND